MKRTRKKRGLSLGILGLGIFLLILIGLLRSFIVPWVMKPEQFREEKDQLRSLLFHELEDASYDAKSLLLEDRSNGEIYLSKKEEEPLLPASLAKLFVIEYAATLADLDAIVPARPEAIAMTPPGSSVAAIQAKNYYLRNLIAAMLVPSGNDAAYVVADYCGGLLSPQTEDTAQRIDLFMDNLNGYLSEQGYDNTVLYDPSGFDENARTTALDLKSVTDQLLKYSWFRDMVSQSVYTATLPDGSIHTWENTNLLLDPDSKYYHENVTGIKTGSLSQDYNLLALYQMYGKEFFICCLGASSDTARYDAVTNLIRVIDESDYLSG